MHLTVFVGIFQGAEKTMVKTGKNRPGKNRLWTGFFHLGGKSTLADRVVVMTRGRKTPISPVPRLLMPTWRVRVVRGVSCLLH